jgi:glycosyltransferase involved in cell wall biosynthesis
VANSKWTAEIIRRKYGANVGVLYPPVLGEFPEVFPEDKELGFVCIGRIDSAKRIERIIDILGLVRRKGHDIHLHIIGKIDNSPYCKFIENICREKSEWVTLEGIRFGAEKARLLSTHLFGIHARQGEAFGVLFEMVKAGVSLSLRVS